MSLVLIVLVKMERDLDIRRTSYTIFEKRKAVEKAKDVGVRSASRELKVPRKNIQRWCKQIDLFDDVVSTRGSSNIRVQRRLREHKAKYPLLEEALIDFIKEERAKLHSVTGKQIRQKALVLFKSLYPGSREMFTASHGWLRRMVKRNKLSFRPVTCVGQKVTVATPECCNVFFDETMSLDSFHVTMAMDETSCYIDMPSSATFVSKVVKTVKIRTTGNGR